LKEQPEKTMKDWTVEERLERMEGLLKCVIDSLTIPLPKELQEFKMESQEQQMCKEPEKQCSLEEVVSNMLREIGVPAHIKGYQYVRTAIMICVEDMDKINFITKCLYPDIAKQYLTTASRVERAIRHSIEVAWGRGNHKIQDEIFGYSINSGRGKPTNSEFVAMIADKIRLQLKQMM